MTSAEQGRDGASVARATRWAGVGQVLGQVLRVFVLLALAWLIEKPEWGLLELAMVVLGFVEVVRAVGTSEYVIRSTRNDDAFFGAVFSLNVLLGAAWTALLWFAAEPIAAMLPRPEPRCAPLIQGLGLVFVISSVGQLSEALLRKRLQFERIAVVLFVGPLVYGAVALSAAASGWGATSFVAGGIAEAAVTALLYLGLAGWWPVPRLAIGEAWAALRFGVVLMLCESLRALTAQADRIVIHATYASSSAEEALGAVGVYGLARRLTDQALKPMLLVFHKVVLPALAAVQDDAAALRRRFLQSVASIGLVALPLVAVLAVLTPSLVELLGQAKWGASEQLIPIVAPGAGLFAVASSVGVVFVLLGHTRALLVWSIAASAVLVAAYCVGSTYDLVGVAAGFSIASALLFVPAFVFPLRWLSASWGQLVRALAPNFALAMVAAAVAWIVRWALQSVAAAAWIELGLAGLFAAAAVLLLATKLEVPGLATLRAMLPRSGPAR